MQVLEINYDGIKKRLDRVSCPFRLYPEVIRALETVINKDLLLDIQRNITSKIHDYVDMEWVNQFISDFELFGLYEAILYFHTYCFPDKANKFICDACDCYHAIASLYMNHRYTIENSDDPRIIAQLEAIKRGKGLYRKDSKLEMDPITGPIVIEPPVEPPFDPEYERALPMPDDLKDLMEWEAMEWNGEEEGSGAGPGNLANELIDHLWTEFTFEGFPGIQFVFSKTADLLQRFEISPFSSAGQFVLLTICEFMEMEIFGDFDRFVDCIICGEFFKPAISISNVNINIIRGGWVCDECQKTLEMNFHYK